MNIMRKNISNDIKREENKSELENEEKLAKQKEHEKAKLVR